MWDGRPVRLLGIQTSHIKKMSDGVQLSLFDDKNMEKLEKLDRAMDSIREKYGSDAVRRASFLEKSDAAKRKIDAAPGKEKHFGR